MERGSGPEAGAWRLLAHSPGAPAVGSSYRRGVVRRHPLIAYAVLAVGFSWAWWGWCLLEGWVTRPG